MMALYTELPDPESTILKMGRPPLDRSNQAASNLSLQLDELREGPSRIRRPSFDHTHRVPSTLSIQLDEIVESTTRAARPGLIRGNQGNSNVSIQLDDLGEGPTRSRRPSFSIANRTNSNMSIQLDDVRDLRAEMSKTFSNFSLNCWDEEPGESNSDFFGLAEEVLGDDEAAKLIGEAQWTVEECCRMGLTPDTLKMVVPEEGTQQVRFCREIEVIDIDMPDRTCYPDLYYGVNEIQQMVNEYKLEANSRWHTIR